jgi:hypothetical protein
MRMGRPGFLTLVAALGVAHLEAQPVMRTIAGNPLTIRVAGDTSIQVDDPFEWIGGPVFQPGCLPGVEGTGDFGVLVRVGGVVYGPDFGSHPCGSTTGGVTPWTTVSISEVAGSGSNVDPFRVVIQANAGATGLQLTETLRYSNGTRQLTPTLRFTNVGSGAVTWKTYVAASFAYLSFPILEFGRPGVHDAFKFGAPFPACGPNPYRVLLPAADRYTGNPAPAPWSEIAAGDLSNTLYGGCPSDGVATEWTDRTLSPGESLTLDPGSGISFLAGPDAATSVPDASMPGRAILVAAIALAGWLVLSRRTAA